MDKKKDKNTLLEYSTSI